MSGAGATRASPNTLARFARWLDGMISPPRAPPSALQHASARSTRRARAAGAAEAGCGARLQHFERPRRAASARASWVRGGVLAGRGGVRGAVRRRARPPRAPRSRADRARAARSTHETRDVIDGHWGGRP